MAELIVTLALIGGLYGFVLYCQAVYRAFKRWGEKIEGSHPRRPDSL